MIKQHLKVVQVYFSLKKTIEKIVQRGKIGKELESHVERLLLEYQYNEIDIEIELANGQNSITIENLTTGQRLEIRNLPSDVHHILIQNERLKHIKDVDNPSRNMRPYFNKVFIHLTYGVNNIRITGVGKVRFISQAKLTLI